MCNVCCKELNGWIKSFTRTETGLAILQLVFLIVLLCSLVFLILHFLACEGLVSYDTIKQSINVTLPENTTMNITSTTTIVLHTYRTTNEIISLPPKTTNYMKTTFNKSLECSWTQSHKTVAQTRFFDIVSTRFKPKTQKEQIFHSTKPYLENFDDIGNEVTYKRNKTFTEMEDLDDMIPDNISGLNDETILDYDISIETDVDVIDEVQPKVVLALVKIKPPADMTFGCILTIVTKHWTLTAASCIESIEEMDSLDDFVMMEDYGSVRKGMTHLVTDVQIHPLYEGVNRSYDLAALKSDSNLLKRSAAVELASLMDYLTLTIGERFPILGYGSFRSIDKSPGGKRLRRAFVYNLPSGQCPEESGWALRHLWAGEAVHHAACGAPAVCAGVLHARGLACNYCAGTPLLGAGALLYGLMSDGDQCGVSCEPQIYVNIAAVRDWIDSVVRN